jgi:hypothetical protein
MSDVQTPRQVLDNYLGGTEVSDFSQAVSESLIDINKLPTDQKSQAFDTLLGELPNMLTDVDIFDRVVAAQVSATLKRIYDADAGYANPTQDLQLIMETNGRAIKLMQMRLDVNRANQRFGVLELSSRTYVTPLVETPQEAEIMRADGNMDQDDYVVMEHYGEKWESYLELNTDIDIGEWQRYIKAYHEQILEKLHPLSKIPILPSSTISDPNPPPPEEDETEVPLPDLDSAVMVPETISVNASGSVEYLQPATGIQKRSSTRPPDSFVAGRQVRTGDRDARRRAINIPANLNGLAEWVVATYRTYGDTVRAVETPEGGIISVTITGDFLEWERRTRAMRIPAPLDYQSDSDSQSITISYS